MHNRIKTKSRKEKNIYYGLREQVTSVNIDVQDLVMILRNVSSNSIYSVQQDINNGFVSIDGGHRIGVVGEVVIDEIKDNFDKNVENIKDSINKTEELIQNQEINVLNPKSWTV